MNCNHPRLTKAENVEMGGTASTIYQCDECSDLLTVTITPMEADEPTFGTTS
ncbi:MAG: hypothetical protein ACJ71W_05980 [Terriglobales bacterium]